MHLAFECAKFNLIACLWMWFFICEGQLEFLCISVSVRGLFMLKYIFSLSKFILNVSLVRVFGGFSRVLWRCSTSLSRANEHLVYPLSVSSSITTWHHAFRHILICSRCASVRRTASTYPCSTSYVATSGASSF